MIDAERRPERGDELFLARGFRELARQRFARVAHRGVDEILLFAAPRRADRRCDGRRARSRPRTRSRRSEPRGSTARGGAPAVRGRIGRERRRAPPRRRAPGRRAENRRGCPSSGRCGRRTPRCRTAPASSVTANTSASAIERGLTLCSPWIADSALMRSRNRAAFSKSSAAAASLISAARRCLIARLRPERKSRAWPTSSA